MLSSYQFLDGRCFVVLHFLKQSCLHDLVRHVQFCTRMEQTRLSAAHLPDMYWQAVDLGACIGLVAAGLEAVAQLTTLTKLNLSGYSNPSLSFYGNQDESHVTSFHGLRDIVTGLTGGRDRQARIIGLAT